VGLNGGLGDAANNLEGQIGAQSGSPLDFSGLPQLDYGENAFNKASDAAYGQMTSRLDPQWKQAEEAERTRLINQGLDPGSEAAQSDFGNFFRAKNDAYQGANNASIDQGLKASNQMFNQSFAAHNQGLNELLQKRNDPYNHLSQLRDFTQMPNFNQDNSTLAGAGMQGAQDMQRYLQNLSQQTDAAGGIGTLVGILGKIIPFL
jgi:hypothetical protein